MTDISIIDYNAGNLFSVKSACEKVGLNAIITGNPEVIINSKAAILPGVGAFGEAMINLKSNQLDKVIVDFISQEKPMLGICLGMQLLFDKSDEFGSCSGLGIIRGTVNKFNFKESELKKEAIENEISSGLSNLMEYYENEWTVMVIEDDGNEVEMNLDLPFTFKLTHIHRKDMFGYNWQLNEDRTPLFVKHSYNWVFNGIPKDQRTII